VATTIWSSPSIRGSAWPGCGRCCAARPARVQGGQPCCGRPSADRPGSPAGLGGWTDRGRAARGRPRRHCRGRRTGLYRPRNRSHRNELRPADFPGPAARLWSSPDAPCSIPVGGHGRPPVGARCSYTCRHSAGNALGRARSGRFPDAELCRHDAITRPLPPACRGPRSGDENHRRAAAQTGPAWVIQEQVDHRLLERRRPFG
jgi:hypothetical protein